MILLYWCINMYINIKQWIEKSVSVSKAHYLSKYIHRNSYRFKKDFTFLFQFLDFSQSVNAYDVILLFVIEFLTDKIIIWNNITARETEKSSEKIPFAQHDSTHISFRCKTNKQQHAHITVYSFEWKTKNNLTKIV